MKKTIIFLIIVILVILSVVLVLRNNESTRIEVEDGEPLQLEQENSQVIEEVESDIKEEISVLNLVKQDNATELTDLKAVDGSNSSGTAYRLLKDGQLYHAVVASMPNPKDNNKYEGWLVQPSPLKFFSTGVMSKDENNMWILEYVSDQESPSYKRVVITEETKVDAIPEKHIIEGDFN